MSKDSLPLLERERESDSQAYLETHVTLEDIHYQANQQCTLALHIEVRQNEECSLNIKREQFTLKIN